MVNSVYSNAIQPFLPPTILPLPLKLSCINLANRLELELTRVLALPKASNTGFTCRKKYTSISQISQTETRGDELLINIVLTVIFMLTYL